MSSKLSCISQFKTSTAVEVWNCEMPIIVKNAQDKAMYGVIRE